MKVDIWQMIYGALVVVHKGYMILKTGGIRIIFRFFDSLDPKLVLKIKAYLIYQNFECDIHQESDMVILKPIFCQT